LAICTKLEISSKSAGVDAELCPLFEWTDGDFNK